MRIGINLATRPFADLRPALKNLRIAMGVLVLAAVGMGFGLRALDQKAEKARERDHALDGQIAHLTKERSGYEALMHEPQNAAVLAQAENLNQLFDEKAFSWTLAMEDLETVLPGGVQVTTLEPARDKEGHITLRLRVLGPRDRAIDLVRNLEHSRRFVRPRIVDESGESNGGPNERMEPVSASNRVNFDVLADYNPAAPEDHKVAKSRHADADESAAPEQPMNLAPGAHRPAYTEMARPRKPLGAHAGGPQ